MLPDYKLTLHVLLWKKKLRSGFYIHFARLNSFTKLKACTQDPNCYSLLSLRLPVSIMSYTNAIKDYKCFRSSL